ncbi:High-affinity choline transporter 1 [Amphibalanus amphitrite]|uniref:High-affinity choline transporter 1 n=1 Tax=Amphibalanus amphitrite TaxID=1232801 RepID=A0A6A4X2D7_AMPAM|nr:High-affinity choline transporter 1 [Amphibalanus amphitrite]
MFNWAGLAGIIVFYIAILLVGLWAAWKRKKELQNAEEDTEEVMLAGRNLGVFVGILTMTATWVGGGYINGSAEETYKAGLVWTQAPFGYSISLALGGIFFAHKMREEGYTTMLDPLQAQLGRVMGGLLFIPALLGELFWSAAILGALGTTINVILHLDEYVDYGNTLSIALSAAIAVFYTLFGGLLSVAYTDVIQLICIFIGLWFSIPFAMSNEAFTTLDISENDWIGSVEPHYAGVWFDYAMLLICGGIPWQVYFQRVLSSKSPRRSQLLSYAAAGGCIFLAIPAVLIGAIAKGTKWEMTEYGRTPTGDDTRFVLPLVMQYLTPEWVAFIGLGAVSAAVMSSADSSVLSSSTMFSRNIYQQIFRPRASEREIIIVMKIAILVNATVACVIAINVPSIYGLFFLCSDLVFVILFPQLLCFLLTEHALFCRHFLCSDLVFVILFPQLLTVVHVPRLANTYGSMLAALVGLALRLAGGESLLGLPATLHYWWYSDTDGQLFPFRTFAMVCSLCTLVVTSFCVEKLFSSGTLPSRLDFARSFDREDSEATGLNYRQQQHDLQKNGIDNYGMTETTGL